MDFKAITEIVQNTIPENREKTFKLLTDKFSEKDLCQIIRVNKHSVREILKDKVWQIVQKELDREQGELPESNETEKEQNLLTDDFYYIDTEPSRKRKPSEPRRYYETNKKSKVEKSKIQKSSALWVFFGIRHHANRYLEQTDNNGNPIGWYPYLHGYEYIKDNFMYHVRINGTWHHIEKITNMRLNQDWVKNRIYGKSFNGPKYYQNSYNF